MIVLTSEGAGIIIKSMRQICTGQTPKEKCYGQRDDRSP